MKTLKISNAPLMLYAIISVCWQTTVMAAPLDALPNSPHPNATLPAMEARVGSLGGSLWSFIKACAILLGLILVISSLLKIRDISNGKKDGSLGGAFGGLVIGGMMSSVAIWLFAFAKTAEDVSGAGVQ